MLALWQLIEMIKIVGQLVMNILIITRHQFKPVSHLLLTFASNAETKNHDVSYPSAAYLHSFIALDESKQSKQPPNIVSYAKIPAAELQLQISRAVRRKREQCLGICSQKSGGYKKHVL
jgi:hypothetical protein